MLRSKERDVHNYVSLERLAVSDLVTAPSKQGSVWGQEWGVEAQRSGVSCVNLAG